MDGMDRIDGVDGVDGIGRGDDERDDGLVLEVSDLRAASAVRDDGHAEPPRAGPSRAGTARRPGSILASRRARGYAVAGLVLLACAALFLGLPGPRQALLGALAGPTPTPTATLAPGEHIVGFIDGVPWGTLTIDGKPADQQPGAPNALGRGRHAVAYRAAPFAPLACQLSVPRRPDDTCPPGAGEFSSLDGGRVVDLGCTPDRLPPDQREALLRAVAAALEVGPQSVHTTTVEPGDHYLGADGAPAVAPARLQATLALALNTAPGRPEVPDCVTLCVFAWVGPAGDGWIVWAHVVARWQFAAADGSPIRPGGPGAELDALLAVGARWTGEWSVTRDLPPPYSSNLCSAALADVIPMMPTSNDGWLASEGQAPDVADGCVELLAPSQGNGGPPSAKATPTPTPDPAVAPLVLYRFGVLLAANDAAHAAVPQLPVANAHERALALGWLRQTP